MSAPRVSIDKKRIALFTKILFAYYRKEGRSMPWRDTTDPYCILVSEIMLQQTQVDRVKGKYQEFMQRFPTARTLAEAPLGDVLRLWSGLGYNRRAKYLHVCAKEIKERGGAFPKTMEELVGLPGVGRSTAAGVMAFSWNLPEPMIDTNLRRVLHRVFFPRSKMSDKELYAFAKSIIPKGKGREWNYAMLDLAATKCTARNHADDCPIREMHGVVKEISKLKRQTRFVDTDRYARGRILETLRNTQTSATLATLTRGAERDKKKTIALLEKLVHEGLVAKKNGRYELP
jgi:A/G-specific adenine glycosylase